MVGDYLRTDHFFKTLPLPDKNRISRKRIVIKTPISVHLNFSISYSFYAYV